MTQPLAVERLGPSDAPRLRQALERLVPEPDRPEPVPPPEYLAALLAAPSSYVLLARLGADPAGYLTAYRFPRVEQRGEQVYLLDIMVAPAARRRGIGRRLIERLLEECRGEGVALVWAGTGLENTAAQRTFEAAGGRRVSERYVEYHFPLLITTEEEAMAKKLNCRDLGMNCDFTTSGDTEEEVLRKAAVHARTAHQITDMTPELTAKVRAAIHTA